MGLMIGVRFIESGKSKRALIINEIRGRNAYPSGTTKFKPTGNSGEGGAIGSKTDGSYAGDRMRDESFGEAADVEESSTSSG